MSDRDVMSLERRLRAITLRLNNAAKALREVAARIDEEGAPQLANAGVAEGLREVATQIEVAP